VSVESSRLTLLLVAGAYGVAVAAIGVWSRRRTRTARDFWVAGQGLGLLVTALATASAAFSGFVFVGGPGLMYRIGFSSLMIVVPLSITGVLLGWTVAARLRLLATVREVYTVPDAFLARFGSPRLAGLAAVFVAIGSIAYLGAQVQALGILLEALFDWRPALGDWSLPLAMGVGLVVLLSYAVAGGMIAGVYTDVLQGGLMVLAAAGVFHWALRAGGGWRPMLDAIAGDDRFGAAFFDPLQPAALLGLGFFLVFGVGVLGQPHMLHKFLMLRDVERLRWLPLVLAATQSLCLLMWIGVGLAVPALVARGLLAPLANPDDAAPAFLLGWVPPLLAGLVTAGILAAVMSTADSFLNLGAAALVRDLPRALGRPVRDELATGRRAVAVLGVTAALFAWWWGDLVALLGTFAFGAFAAALAPALTVGLVWQGLGRRAAAASIAGGGVLHLVLEIGQRVGWWSLPGGLPPAAVSLVTSFALLFLVAAFERAPPLAADVCRALNLSARASVPPTPGPASRRRRS
jgi:Na+/proline symporter